MSDIRREARRFYGRIALKIAFYGMLLLVVGFAVFSMTLCCVGPEFDRINAQNRLIGTIPIIIGLCLVIAGPAYYFFKMSQVR